MSIYLVTAFTVLGLILFTAAGHSKLTEIGRILLFCGTLALMLSLMGHTLKLSW